MEHKSEGDDFKIPFQVKGVNGLFDTHAPTDEEKESLPQIVLAGPEWRPEEIRMVGRINVDRRRRVCREFAQAMSRRRCFMDEML